MTKHKALLLLERKGDLIVDDIDIPSPQPGELLVEVQAAGLNPFDWMVAKLGIAVGVFPAILGSDSAGIVKEVGEGVAGFEVGDKVLHQGTYKNRHATFQQHVVVPADIAAKIPPNVTFDQAASIPVGIATAAFGLYSNVPSKGAGLTPFWAKGGRGKYAGQPIVILGGSSNVGQQVVQLARLSGFSPVIATASLHNASLLESLGVSHVIDRYAPLAPSVRAVTSDPILFVYDAVAIPQTQDAGWDILAPKGTLILVGSAAIDKGKLEEGKRKGKVIASVFGSPFDQEQRELGAQLYKHITATLESGDLKPNAIEVLPNGLAGIPDGLERLSAGAVSATKLIAHPQETR